MAADLTPRFRRLNSQTQSFRENIRHGLSGPFRATGLWQDVIRALRAQVEVGTRRRHLRLHDDCFTGAAAVDAVLSFLMQSAAFGAGQLSRPKAARLCQALMEARVFRPVGTKLFRRHAEPAFEDGGGSLYRFLEPPAPPGAEKQSPGGAGRRTPARSRELKTISNPLALGASDRRLDRLLRTLHLQPHPPDPTLPPPACCLSKAAVEEVWQQQTLLLLLQTVELPVLEGLLSPPPRAPAPRGGAPPCAGRQDLVISNVCLERELHPMLNLPRLDDWLLAAADCLELLPDRLVVAAGERLAEDHRGPPELHKRLLLDLLARHYGGLQGLPLLAGRHAAAHAAAHGLLERGMAAEALTAWQLCVRLMCPGPRDQLRRLLAFMATAAAPHACLLHKQIANRTFVCRTFQKAIVQSSELTRGQCEALVLFLMDSHRQLFKTPGCLTEAVHKTLRDRQNGKDPDSIATFTFCQQVTPQQYEDQREAATGAGLRALLGAVVRSDRRRLRDFQKLHPAVFLQPCSGGGGGATRCLPRGSRPPNPFNLLDF